MKNHLLGKKRTGAGRKLLRVILLLVFVAVMLLVLGISRLRPMIRPIAIARAKSLATRAINDAVELELRDAQAEYENLIELEKDSENRVTALKTNTVKINELKATLSVAILNRIADLESTVISIPLGNIISSELFSGMGPTIKITLIPVGFVETNVQNSFTAAGINQTRHQILLDVTATIGIVMPTYTEYASVNTSIILGESVLLGMVPDSYTNVDTYEQLLYKITNFLELG